MRIGIVVNPHIAEAADLARKIADRLSKAHDVIFEERSAKILGKVAGDISSADLIITLGGDGTVLRGHSMAQSAVILGVNMGNRGFLAEVGRDEVDRVVDLILADKLHVEERMRLKVSLGGESIPEALNDVVLSSAVPGKTSTIRISIDGVEILSFRGDGLIVSTPTGSTAYTKAAGGPVVFPGIDCVIITAICPLNSKIPPMVIPADKKVTAEVGLPGQPCLLIVDGLERARLPHGARVEISVSDKRARFIRWGDFCSRLREKIL
jgi:NAD+ kinase